MIKSTVIILLSIFPLTGSVAQSEPGGSKADRKDIRDLVGDYQKAREDSDSLQLLSLLTDDADQLVSSGEWRKGKEELVKGMQRSSRNNEGRRSIEVEQIRFVGKAVAIADARYTISGNDPDSARRMWSTFICQRIDENWRIAAIRNMLPARPGN
ncbi:MAG: SgcJ/EcaC family oxidoreductase [Saprospiraceae bacterium]|nr:SgcJ/EcaC family oxidoreductase [Saprospiraceae bacterium]